MKRSVWLLVPWLCASLPSARADALDDAIAGLRDGAPRDSAKDAQAIQKGLASTSASQRRTMADAYLAQVKASIVDEVNHGGWPFRSWLVYQPTPRRMLTPTLKSRFERTPDPILAYAIICPALYAKDDVLLSRAMDYLAKHDPFLHERANAQMKQYWAPFIAETLKKQAGTSKAPKPDKDDPFSLLPKQ